MRKTREWVSVHARVFRCGGSLPSPRATLRILFFASPSSLQLSRVELSESQIRDSTCAAWYAAVALPCSSSSSLPCLLRVVRSFRICWIARPFFFSFFSCFLKARTATGPGDYGARRDEKTCGFSVRMNRWTEEMRGLVIRAFSGPRTRDSLTRPRLLPSRASVKKLPTGVRIRFRRLPPRSQSRSLARLFRISWRLRAFLTARLKWHGTEDYVGRFGDREYFDIVETSPWQKWKNRKIAFARFPFYQIWLDSFSGYSSLLGLLNKRALRALSCLYLARLYLEKMLLQRIPYSFSHACHRQDSRHIIFLAFYFHYSWIYV